MLPRKNSTSQIEEKLEQASLSGEEDDDGFVIVQQPPIVVDEIPSRMVDAWELSADIYQHALDHFHLEKTLEVEDTGLALHVFIDKERKIFLFKTVKDCDINVEEHLPNLEKALEFFNEWYTLARNDVLVVPVAELGRRHFRYLSITPDEILYCDSKGYLASKAASFFGPLVPASIQAMADLGFTPAEFRKEIERLYAGLNGKDFFC